MAEFDKFAQNYTDDLAKDLGSFGKYKDTAFLYKSQYLKYVLPEEPSGILDFGCGVGSNIPYLKKYFPNAKLFGCDVSSESIKIAEDNYQYCEFSIINTPEELKQYKGNVNVVFISTVLHHIPPTEHEAWVDGLFSVLNSGGFMVIFEHNMKNPVTAKVVRRAKGDEGAVMLDASYCKQLVKNSSAKYLLGGNNVKLRYTYFFPWRNNLFTIIERFLWFIPLGAQYCVYVKKTIKNNNKED